MDYTVNPTKPYLIVAGATTNAPIGGFIYEINTTNLTTTTQVVFGVGTTGAQANSSAGFTSNTHDYRGDLNIIVARGQLFVSPKKVGIAAATGYTTRIVPSHPQAIVSGGALALSSGTQSVAGTTVFGHGGSLHTNGIRLFGSWTATANSDNRIYIETGLHNVAYSGQGFVTTGKLTVKG
jgi:hypothetical protein